MNVKILRSNSNRYQLWLVAVALLALIGLIAAGSGFAGSSHTTSTAVVKTRKISGLGVVLINKNGRTLYIFMKDEHRKVTCTGACTSFWKALKWKGSGKPKAGGAAKSKLLGVVKSSRGKVVTYNHWPLYTYVGDSKAGQAKGEGSTLSGAKWYVMSAKGTIVKQRSSGGCGTTTTCGGGWG
jgi:predicted lipoprotein with Yx(FWY)xxD motif